MGSVWLNPKIPMLQTKRIVWPLEPKIHLRWNPFDWTCFKAWRSSSFRSLCHPQTLLTIYITPLPSHRLGLNWIERRLRTCVVRSITNLSLDIPVTFYQYDSPCTVKLCCFILSASPLYRSWKQESWIKGNSLDTFEQINKLSLI